MYGLQRVCRLGEQKLMKNLSDHFYVFFFFSFILKWMKTIYEVVNWTVHNTFTFFF